MSKIIYEIATSVKYGNYKNYKPQAVLGKDFIERNIKTLTKCFKLPPKVHIVCRPIRGDIGGLAYKKNKEKKYFIEIDPRLSNYMFVSVLLHELTHIEQFFKGKLDISGEFFIWKKKTLFKPLSPDHINYEMQPWEREADLRAAKLCKKILNEL
jgi:hypothetical protein